MAFLAPLAVPLAIGSSILGGGLTAFSAIQQGNYRAAVAKNNALIAEQNAARLSEAAQESAKRSDIESAALLGEQWAAQGASGLDVSGRSARAGRMLTRRVGRQQARDIVTQGVSDARNQLQEAANFRGEASAAKKQGLLTAIGAGIGAAGDVGSLMSKGSMLKRGSRGPRSWYGNN